MGTEQRKALMEKLHALLELKGVVAVSKYEITADQDFHLPRSIATVGHLQGDVSWWVMNFCEMSLTLCQAEAIDYDNITRSRRFFPPGAVFIRGKEWSFLGTANRVTVVLRNADKPNLWEIIAQSKAL